MTRTKTAPTTINHDDIDSNNHLAVTANEMAAHSALIVKQYGHDIPYSREHYLSKARGHIMRSAEEVLELGRCLIVMKENESHGDWLPIIEELSIERTFATRTMQAAIKFGSSPTSKNLIDAAKSKTKLFELMVLDDQQLEQLNDGETVAGINLDDIDRMPASQLRAALRKAREEHEDLQGVVEDKNKKIDAQAKKINKINRQAPDETVMQMRTEISGMQSNIEHDIRTNLFNAINELQTQEGDDHNAFIESQLKLLADAVAHLQESFLTADWEK